jgi:hypothetical protein
MFDWQVPEKFSKCPMESGIIDPILSYPILPNPIHQNHIQAKTTLP